MTAATKTRKAPAAQEPAVGVDQAALRAAVDLVCESTGDGNMSKLLLASEGGTLRVVGTNLTTTTSATVPMAGRLPAVAVDAKHLRDILRAAAGPVRLSVPARSPEVKTRLRIESGRASFDVVDALNGTDSALFFPRFPEAPAQLAEVGRDDLLALLDQTSYAADHGGKQPALCSLRLEIGGGVMRIVAIDGHRLALAERKCGASPMIALVPLDGIKVWRKLLEKAPERVRVGRDEAHAYLAGGDAWVAAKLVDRPFPECQGVIDDAVRRQGAAIEAGRDTLLTALHRAMIIAPDVRLGIAAKEIQLSAVEPALGEENEVLDVDGAQVTKAARFKANGRYLRQALEAMPDAVRLRVGTGMDPVTVEPQDTPAGERRLAVIMPIRDEQH